MGNAFSRRSGPVNEEKVLKGRVEKVRKQDHRNKHRKSIVIKSRNQRQTVDVDNERTNDRLSESAVSRRKRSGAGLTSQRSDTEYSDTKEKDDLYCSAKVRQLKRNDFEENNIIGQRIQVLWGDEGAWFDAVVLKVKTDYRIKVRFVVDGMVIWLTWHEEKVRLVLDGAE